MYLLINVSISLTLADGLRVGSAPRPSFKIPKLEKLFPVPMPSLVQGGLTVGFGGLKIRGVSPSLNEIKSG